MYTAGYEPLAKTSDPIAVAANDTLVAHAAASAAGSRLPLPAGDNDAGRGFGCSTVSHGYPVRHPGLIKPAPGHSAGPSDTNANGRDHATAANEAYAGATYFGADGRCIWNGLRHLPAGDEHGRHAAGAASRRGTTR
jgi:hypothetical protein